MYKKNIVKALLKYLFKMSSNNTMTDTIQENKEKFMNLIEKFGDSDNLTPTQVNELSKIPIVLLSHDPPETLEDWLGLYEIPEEKDSYYTHKFPSNRSEFLEDGGKTFVNFLRKLAKEDKIQKLGCGENHFIDDLFIYVHFFYKNKEYRAQVYYYSTKNGGWP